MSEGQLIPMAVVNFQWRGEFTNAELNALHAEAFNHCVLDIDWWRQVSTHSLGWGIARENEQLVGFVNLAWDGGVHAFLLDTIVSARHRHAGIGTRLVRMATDEARAANCEWLHVDFVAEHGAFYLEACGFKSTPAGLIALRG